MQRFKMERDAFHQNILKIHKIKDLDAFLMQLLNSLCTLA